MTLKTMACVAALIGAALATGAASAQSKLGGKLIVNQHSGKCIDVAGAPGTANGARLLLWDCERTGQNPNGSPTDHRWEMTPQGFIRNRLSGKCIDVAGAPGTANGAPIILWDCETSGKNPNGSQTDQQWEFTSAGLIRNKLSGKCIDVPGAPGNATGAKLQLFTCEVAGGAFRPVLAVGVSDGRR